MAQSTEAAIPIWAGFGRLSFEVVIEEIKFMILTQINCVSIKLQINFMDIKVFSYDYLHI